MSCTAPLFAFFATVFLKCRDFNSRVLAHSAETGANLWFIDNAHPGGVTALALSHNRRFILTGVYLRVHVCLRLVFVCCPTMIYVVRTTLLHPMV